MHPSGWGNLTGLFAMLHGNLLLHIMVMLHAVGFVELPGAITQPTRFRTRNIEHTSVSYTHLTLPTICSV